MRIYHNKKVLKIYLKTLIEWSTKSFKDDFENVKSVNKKTIIITIDIIITTN